MTALSFGTPGSTDFQSKLASMLANGALDNSPIQSPWQGASRLAQALLTGLEIRDQDTKDKNLAAALTNLPGLSGTTAVPTAPSATIPAMPSSSTPIATIPNDSNALPGQVGMDTRLADRTQDFIQDNPGTSMSSGVRSTADQARLYADRGNNPNPVAPPGTSMHERGMAADIGGMTPQQRALLPQYGLAQPVANDPPHVELAQALAGQPVKVASADPNFVPQAGMAQALVGPPPQAVPATQVAQASPQATAPTVAQGRPAATIPPQVAAQIKGYLGSSDPRMRQLGMQLYQQYGTPVENKVLQTPDGTVLSVNPRSNAVSPIYKSGDKPTSLMQNLEAAGLKPGTPEYQKAVLDASKTTTTINNTVNPVLKGVGDRFNEDMDTARASIPQINGIFEARKALDQGAITGAGADPKLFAAKAASLFGLGGDAAQNTEVLRSSIGNSVLAKAKTLGANPSNADREYIEKIMGGSIQLEEGSMRRLLDIQEKWARSAIDRANKQGQALLSAQPDELKNIGGLLQVQQPQTYDEFLKANPIAQPQQQQSAPAMPDGSTIENEMRRRGLLK